MPTRLMPIAESPVARIETTPTMETETTPKETTKRQLVGCVSQLHDSPEHANSSRVCPSGGGSGGGGGGDGGAASPTAPRRASPNTTRGRRTRGASLSWDFFSRGGKSSDGGGSPHADGGAVLASPSPLVPIFFNLGGVGGQQGQRQNLAVAGCVLQLSAQCEYGDAAADAGRGGDARAIKPAPRKSDDSFLDWHDTEPHHPAAKLLLTTISSPLVMATKEIEADGYKCIWNQTFHIELPSDALTTTAMLRIDLSARAHHGGLVRAASGRVALSEVRGNAREVGRARRARARGWLLVFSSPLRRALLSAFKCIKWHPVALLRGNHRHVATHSCSPRPI